MLSGSLHSTNAYSSGSMVMEEKVLPFDKSGFFLSLSKTIKFRNLLVLLVFVLLSSCHSNVVAATDLTLLALAGFGLHYGKVRLYESF